jgi:REP element-mobilizing transposase RayT
VVLPDHFHLLLGITGKKNISEVMHDLKSYASHQISKMLLNKYRRGFHASPHTINESPKRGSFGSGGRKYVKIWQPSFYDHVIRNKTDFNNHVNYIHYNPVKHSYVKKMEDWSWSSYTLYKQ